MTKSETSQSLRNAVATRKLKVNKGKKSVMISIGKPKKVFLDKKRKDSDWACCFMISGNEETVKENAYGVDSLQAFLMAIRGIEYYLKKSNKNYGWVGCDENPGFPDFKD